MVPDDIPDADPGDGGDIIIKGGSCEIHYKRRHFPKGVPEAGRDKHARRVSDIKRIVIKDDKGNVKFDEAFDNGFKGEVTVFYEPKKP